MLYLHKKQSPTGHGRTNIALSGSRCFHPKKGRKIVLRDFPQKEKWNPAKFQRKKSLKILQNQSILATDTS